jgi:hypothetical protein
VKRFDSLRSVDRSSSSLSRCRFFDEPGDDADGDADGDAEEISEEEDTEEGSVGRQSSPAAKSMGGNDS